MDEVIFSPKAEMLQIDNASITDYILNLDDSKRVDVIFIGINKRSEMRKLLPGSHAHSFFIKDSFP